MWIYFMAYEKTDTIQCGVNHKFWNTSISVPLIQFRNFWHFMLFSLTLAAVFKHSAPLRGLHSFDGYNSHEGVFLCDINSSPIWTYDSEWWKLDR